MAATCDRTRFATSATKPRMRPRSCALLRWSAIVAAVIAGCFVASVPCRKWISTKDSA